MIAREGRGGSGGFNVKNECERILTHKNLEAPTRLNKFLLVIN